MILCLKTDAPETYIGVWDSKKEVSGKKWESGRELSSQLLSEIEHLLKKAGTTFEDLKGIIIYEGPGSYTGLRIGFSIANALGYSLKIPVVACGGKDWIAQGFKKLLKTNKFVPVKPLYGGQVRITRPKK